MYVDSVSMIIRPMCLSISNASLKNFSKDYPVKLFEQTNESIVAEQVRIIEINVLTTNNAIQQLKKENERQICM